MNSSVCAVCQDPCNHSRYSLGSLEEVSQSHLLALYFTRPLIAKYDKDIDNIDLKNNRMKENLITLGNIKSVLYIGLVLILSASETFVAEFCSREMYFLMFT